MERLTSREQTFDTGDMLTGRQDIIGDLARLRLKYLSSPDDADARLDQLELLSAAAVQLGMSFQIVNRACGIPLERIDAVVDAQPEAVSRVAGTYERRPGGVLCRVGTE